MNTPTSYSNTYLPNISRNTFSVREKDVKYAADNSHDYTSVKEMDGVKFVEIDMSAKVQFELGIAGSANKEREIAYNYILENLRGKKYCTPDGRTVDIARRGAKKLTHDAPLTKLRVIPHIPELIEIGQFKGLVSEYNHESFKQFAFYDIIFKIENFWYAGVLNIGIRKDGTSGLYELNPFEEIQKTAETEPPNWASTVRDKTHTAWNNDPVPTDVNNITDMGEKVNP